MRASPKIMNLVMAGALSVNAAPTTCEQFLSDHKLAKRSEKAEAGQRRLDWWRDARFGMFIHWAPSSVAACEISCSKLYYENIGE